MRLSFVSVALVGLASLAGLASADDSRAPGTGSSVRLPFSPFEGSKEGDFGLRRRTVSVKGEDGKTSELRELVRIEVKKTDGKTLTLATSRTPYRKGKPSGDPVSDERSIECAEASVAKLLGASLGPEKTARTRVEDEKLSLAGREFPCTKVTIEQEKDGSKLELCGWFSKGVKASGLVRLVRVVERKEKGGTVAETTEDELVGFGSRDETDWGKSQAELEQELEGKGAKEAREAARRDDDEDDDEDEAPARHAKKNPGFGGEAKITLTLKDVSLKEVVEAVAFQAGVNAPVIVDQGVAGVKISLNLNATPCSEVLDFLKDLTGASVKIENGKIYVAKAP